MAKSVAGSLLSGCPTGRWVEIAAGEYAPVRDAGASGSSSAIEAMAICGSGTACGGAGERISFETASNTTSLRCSVNQRFGSGS
jgi:hypothetical protein